MKKKNPYEDIIHLPHHVSNKHPQMSLSDRAAQFAPFAALTGYDATVKETARFTDNKIELSDDEWQIINKTLQEIQAKITETIQVEIIYFQADARKTGGMYLSYTGYVKKIDTYQQCMQMKDGLTIDFEDILSITLLK